MKTTPIGVMTLLAILLYTGAYAQTPSPASIIGEIDVINQQTIGTSGMIISYPGLNRFLGLKVASYLSDGGDLSLFNNYAVLNTESGKLSINHNFARKTPEGRIKALFTAGVRVSVSDAFSAIVSDSKFSNDIGVVARYTWIGRGSAYFDTDKQVQAAGLAPGSDGSQKMSANRKRAKIRAQLNAAMTQEAADFETYLGTIRTGDLSAGDNLANVLITMRNDFYSSLRTKYLGLFAEAEAKILEDINSQNLVTAGWLSVSAYIPVTTTKYNVAQSFVTSFGEKEIYPWELSLGYTRILESRRYGRLFLHASAGVAQNNTAATGQIAAVDLNSYKDLGGTDTLHYGLLASDKAYVGEFSDFVTPVFRGQVVWFPPSWSIGLSALIEQRTGQYGPLNGKLGIPVKLKGKDDDSFVNFELQARATDLRNTISPEKSRSEKITYGISIGVPFSSMIK